MGKLSGPRLLGTSPADFIRHVRSVAGSPFNCRPARLTELGCNKVSVNPNIFPEAPAVAMVDMRHDLMVRISVDTTTPGVRRDFVIMDIRRDSRLDSDLAIELLSFPGAVDPLRKGEPFIFGYQFPDSAIMRAYTESDICDTMFAVVNERNRSIRIYCLHDRYLDVQLSITVDPFIKVRKIREIVAGNQEGLDKFKRSEQEFIHVSTRGAIVAGEGRLHWKVRLTRLHEGGLALAKIGPNHDEGAFLPETIQRVIRDSLNTYNQRFSSRFHPA